MKFAKKMSWQLPEVDPNDIAAAYVALLRHAPAPVRAWSSTDGAKLHLYTVLDADLTAEAAVYAAEQALLNRYDPSLVAFHVYPDIKPLEPILHELTPLLQPIDAIRG
jgi:hypothetical protein